MSRISHLYCTYVALLCLLALSGVLMQPTPAAANEYRAWWINTVSAGVLDQAGVNKLFGVAGDPNSQGEMRTANVNAVFVEMRLNSTVAYHSGLNEPYFTTGSFDALQAIINSAHDTTGGKKRIEVHAWMVVFRTKGGTVYGRHDDTPTGSLTTLDNYWPSRDSTLPAGVESSSDKPFDPGHPLCEEYLTNVFLDVANNYDVDGVHYDYIRYIANNMGYNPTSVARYNAHYNLPSTNWPSNTNWNWQQWRRDQVSNLVRRVYHKMQILKPSVKVSGSFITGSPGPDTPDRDGFISTPSLQPYTQYYQDWDSWVTEGIVDMGVPMTYFARYDTHQDDWVWWLNYEKDQHGNRQMIIGPGTYKNTQDDAIWQLQQTLTPSDNNNNYAAGFSGYVYQEPYAGGVWDNGLPTSWADTYKAALAPTWTDVPAMPWKTAPTKGHLNGTVINGSKWVDGATMTISGTTKTLDTDGTGFYGFTDLTPGTYTIICNATAQGLGTQTQTCSIVAGQVTVLNFTWGTTTGMAGYVRTSGGVPIAGASIMGANGSYLATSSADGSYTLPGMAAGTYTIKAYKAGCTSDTKSVTIAAGVTTNANFTVNPPGGTISGYVRDNLGNAVVGATVATGSGGYSTASLADGSYVMTGVAPTTYTVTASMPNYSSQTTGNVAVTVGGISTVNFSINPNPTIISSVAATTIATNSAVITWTTNVPASSRVEYGETRNMGTLTALNPALVTYHSVTLTGLTQNRIYHYRVTSANSLSQSATSARYNFFTLPPAGTGGATITIDNSNQTGWSIISEGTLWQTGTSSLDKYGADYRFASAGTGAAASSCAWTPNIPYAGNYTVWVYYPGGTNRADNSPFTINYQGGSITIPVNQQNNGGQWNQLGTASYPFAAGTAGNVTLGNNALAAKVVLADAVQFRSTASSDTAPPTIPTGLTATATSTTQIQLSWTASTDASGVDGYKIYRNGALIDAVDSGTSYTDFELTPNTSCTYTVAAYDIWGNTSAQSASVSEATFSLPIGIACDKPTSTWQTAGNVFTFTNTAGFGGQTIDHIRYVWDQAPSHTWTNTEASWITGTLACTANPGGNNWYLHARAYNSDNTPNGQLDLGPYYCDTTAPSTPSVTAAKYATVTNQLSCTWTSSDPESAIAEYQYAIGTSPGGTTVKGWTTVGTTASAIATGLSLALDQPYYFSVKAKNGAGTWSGVGNNTAGTIPAHMCATIAEAKGLANGKAVFLTGRYVGYGASDGAFIQDPSLPSALYLPDVTIFAPGNIIQVGGVLQTSGLHRVLNSPEPQVTGGPAAIAPYAMAFSNLGGCQLNDWTPGMPGARGANNMGILVRVCGNVTSSTSSYFMMSDGTRQIKVQSTSNPGSGYVIVTGISSWTTSGSQTIPMIMTRTVTDVRVI